MESIQYKIVANTICETPCPHMRNKDGDTIRDIKVASTYCRHTCEFFVSIDENNKIVNCNYGEGINEYKIK